MEVPRERGLVLRKRNKERILNEKQIVDKITKVNIPTYYFFVDFPRPSTVFNKMKSALS